LDFFWLLCENDDVLTARDKASLLGGTPVRTMMKNKLREVRESMLMSKTELAKQANVSPITISRIEKGLPCRMETQRKILLALGMRLSDKPKLFKD